MSSIVINKNNISVSVSVVVFKDGDYYIAYCPSLDLAGYDETVDSAKDDFMQMLSEYFEWQIEHNTLEKDLTKHGWKIGVKSRKEPKFADMIQSNKELRRVVDRFDYSKTSVNFVKSVS